MTKWLVVREAGAGDVGTKGLRDSETVDREPWTAGELVAFLLSEPAHETCRGEFAVRDRWMPASVVPGSQNRDRGAPRVVVSLLPEYPGQPPEA